MPPGDPQSSQAARYETREQPTSPQAFWVLADVAAPLLASASIALLAIVLQAPTTFLVGDWAVVLLLAAAVVFVFSLQATIHARHAANSNLIQAQERWVRRSRLAFNGAIVMFWAGVAIALVPVDGSFARWAAVGLASAAVLLELAWMAAPSLV